MYQTGPHKLDPIAQQRPRFALVEEVVDREGPGFAERRLQCRVKPSCCGICGRGNPVPDGAADPRSAPPLLHPHGSSRGARAARSVSRKPYVLFYTTKRVGGGVRDFDAISW